MWINPEHVVSLVPKVVRDGVNHSLRVELKLAGVPAFDAWLGDFDDAEAADACWASFLTMLRGSEDGAKQPDY